MVNSITMAINLASFLYGTKVLQGTPMAQEPRVKFQYTIDFTLNSADWNNISSSLKREGVRNHELHRDDYTLRAQTAELPGHSYDVQTFNQYNRKRVVTTSVVYNPITLVFHDTVDSKVENLIRAYNLYYFGNFEKPTSTYTLDTTPDKATIDDTDNLSTGGYGYKPPTLNKYKYFFTEIKINRERGNSSPHALGTPISNKDLQNTQAKYTIDQVTIINPMISAVQHDTLSYADSAPITWTINFMYEAIEYGSFYRNASRAGITGFDG